jgi:hypothetical protein
MEQPDRGHHGRDAAGHDHADVRRRRVGKHGRWPEGDHVHRPVLRHRHRVDQGHHLPRLVPKSRLVSGQNEWVLCVSFCHSLVDGAAREGLVVWQAGDLPRLIRIRRSPSGHVTGEPHRSVLLESTSWGMSAMPEFVSEQLGGVAAGPVARATIAVPREFSADVQASRVHHLAVERWRQVTSPSALLTWRSRLIRCSLPVQAAVPCLRSAQTPRSG